jgi:hypothetical protein
VPAISIDGIGKRVAEGSLAPNRIGTNVERGRMMARLRRDVRARSGENRAVVEAGRYRVR